MNPRLMETDKKMSIPAKIFTNVFSPFFASLWVIIYMFGFSVMKQYPVDFKLMIMKVVLFYTIALPMVLILLFRLGFKIEKRKFDTRHYRNIQYAISLLCYLVCYLRLYFNDVYPIIYTVIIASIMVQVLCFIINMWWKVSVHMAGLGGWIGFVYIFSVRFYFDPVPALCMVILITGVLGSCQLVLRQHNLAQVVVGFFTGLVCALTSYQLL